MTTRLNLSIDQGATYSTTFIVRNSNNDIIDLSGYTGNAAIKKTYSSINTAASFTVSVNGSLGQVTLSLTANQSSNVTAGRYVYDVKLTSNTGSIMRVREGIATFNAKVT